MDVGSPLSAHSLPMSPSHGMRYYLHPRISTTCEQRHGRLAVSRPGGITLIFILLFRLSINIMKSCSRQRPSPTWPEHTDYRHRWRRGSACNADLSRTRSECVGYERKEGQVGESCSVWSKGGRELQRWYAIRVNTELNK